DDFRNFFKPDAPKEFATMEEVISITLKVIAQSLVANNIAITVHDNSKTPFLIHKSSLVQVLLNIIGNAKDELVSHKVESAEISITVNETEDKIALSVCDNAGGIPREIIEKINQPYFTTKKVNGTGLGLYISQTIIEKHFFGTLTWHNQLDGACFVITLNKKERVG
ncbi:MAG: HAMP domain-containing sensor histidine kinase, partial [Sulfurimonas sp.]|nr:HAMP domain-containing sensor histidine kinase [Sulfurimonas sp.]